ncbi:MAG: phosphoglycerate dehydrogenase [Chloroflexi bacterium]|nr:phosphoglycerate dehydrogenase [Chloroflexota bacterium]
MSTQKPFSLLVIPDDEPPVLSGTPYDARVRALAERVEWHLDRPASDQETIERLKDADAVINIRSSVRFNRQVLSACSKLKILSVWGTGVDHVDLPAAAELGITVSNTPGYGAPYVSEHALTLALAVSRQIVQNDRHIRQGGWTRGFIDELYGKTLGVVGTGAIGRRMIELGKAIGMRVIAWTVNPTPEREQEYGVAFLPLERLLAEADVVSLHVALSPATERLIGAEQLALMKPTAILVNTARGGVVDQDALLEVLREGRIAGAGLDVFETEPLPAGHPLTELDNVVLSPHAGGMAYNGTMRGLEMSVENLESFAAGNPIYVVAQGNRS